MAAIAEDIDQRRDVGNLLFDQRGSDLPLLQRLGEDGDQHQLLDAETGIDGLDAVTEKLRQPSRIADGFGKTGAEMLARVVDAMHEKVAAPRAEAVFGKASRELADQPAHIFGDGLRCADRLGKILRDLHQLRRSDRLDRFGDAAKHLIQPARGLRPEPQRQRRTRHGRELANRIDTEHAQALDDLRRQPQGDDRQVDDRLHHIVHRHDSRFRRQQPGERMRGAPGVAHGCASRQPAAAQHIDEARHEQRFAAVQVISTFRINDETVGTIDRDNRAILPERPERQPFQRSRILGWRCVDHEKIGDHGLRLAGSHANAQAELQCGGIGGRDPAFRTAAGNDDQRLVSRQGFASVPSDPLRRELWEEDRYDPCHRGLQFRIRRIRRLSRASVPPASAPSRRRQQVVFPTARC